jgi:hypothetical protein
MPGVWPVAASMRRTGELLPITTRIECPLVACLPASTIQPVEAVAVPLTATFREFQIVVVTKCGPIRGASAGLSTSSMTYLSDNSTNGFTVVVRHGWVADNSPS